jgi:hypothetical protein
MLPYTAGNAIRLNDFRVDAIGHPGWARADSRPLLAGEEILCAGGMGTVKEVHGRTGDGSRLVQVCFSEAGKKPFFAAASNLLLPPLGAAPIEVPDDTTRATGTQEEWIGEGFSGSRIL